jgi:2,3-bisphosphoglycerate-independent phosphoglycerate mutase
MKFRPIILVILDGFGITTPSPANAISVAKKPYFDKLTQLFPTMLLEASSLNVGLPWGEIGNSEVGHTNIGSGVLLYQSLPRIDMSIEKGDFFNLPELLKVAENVKKKNSNLHLLGILGEGGVHGHTRHLKALLNFCKKQNLRNVYLHLFLDGRDAQKDSGKIFLKDILDYCQKLGIGQIASLCGRFFAMDRNNNWDRVEKAYRAIALGKAEKTAQDPMAAIEESYKQNVFDEEFLPTVIVDASNNPKATIKKEDSVIFFNYRADRARQLTEAFVLPDFKEFQREFLKGLEFVTFTEYKKGLPVKVLFPPQIIKNPLAKIVSDAGLKQLHIAETEKYAHVTFFLNGQTEEKFKGEERILIPSPAVSNYDQKPEMSANEVTDKIIEAINSKKYGFIAVNYANPDMVGHTGNLQATIKAVETVDKCLEKVVLAAGKQGGIIFIVGDHGNAEELVNLQTGKVDKEHSVYPVPFIIVSAWHEGKTIQEIPNGDLSLLTPLGLLSDVTPTILGTVGLPLAPEMTGNNLLA